MHKIILYHFGGSYFCSCSHLYLESFSFSTAQPGQGATRKAKIVLKSLRKSVPKSVSSNQKRASHSFYSLARTFALGNRMGVFRCNSDVSELFWKIWCLEMMENPSQ